MKLYNHEAEKALLGCLIIDNNLIKKIQSQFNAEYIHNDVHKKLYETIIKLYEIHNVVSIPSLNDFSIDYVSNICDSIMTTSNINHYIKIVTDLAIRRELYKASDKVKEISLDEDIEQIETVKSESLSVINNVTLPEIGKAKRKMADIVLDTLGKLEIAYSRGESAYYKWIIKWIQDKTGGMKSAYTILAARPSIGKTSLALQLGKGIAKQNARVAIFSLETMEDELTNILISNEGNIDNKCFKTPSTLTPELWAKIATTGAEISKLPIHIFDDVFFIEDIILKSQELISSEGLDLIIIDYIQLIETRKKTSTSNEKVSIISRELKKLQQQNGLHILVLSQLKRDSENIKPRPPVLSDLRDSGSLEQDATNVWFLHVDSEFEYQEGKPVETQFIIAKQKNGARNIKTKLKFYGKSQRFYDN